MNFKQNILYESKATSAIWPSILVVKGSKVVLDRTIKKCDWAESFESVEGLGSDFNSETLSNFFQ